MMCQRIGRPPISTIGLGLISVSSWIRLPSPPARIATFMTADALPSRRGFVDELADAGGLVIELRHDVFRHRRGVAAADEVPQRRPLACAVDVRRAAAGLDVRAIHGAEVD